MHPSPEKKQIKLDFSEKAYMLKASKQASPEVRPKFRKNRESPFNIIHIIRRSFSAQGERSAFFVLSNPNR